MSKVPAAGGRGVAFQAPPGSQASSRGVESVNPGDGIVIYKTLRKVKALPDPERKGVMDVSKIKSGVR